MQRLVVRVAVQFLVQGDAPESWVAEAVRGGTRLLAGGTRSGSVVRPAVLTDVLADSPIVSDEVFGPVLVVELVDGVDEGLRRIDDSRFGRAGHGVERGEPVTTCTGVPGASQG